ncbi:MAG: class I SAM-dependent methyltransferase [Cytophagaceae bacterium]|nr:class I SAM-dependent methyltransferase [Cytophagaceae bacterium]
MIGRSNEYERMFRVERVLWWYRALHDRVLRAMGRHIGGKNLRVLDAGCGTGGLLSRLRDAGHLDVRGFDASPDAVAFARQRGLDVDQHDLCDVATFRPGEQYDTIVCNDVLLYLTDEEIRQTLKSFRERLRPGGLLITNNCALAIFFGAHDLSVGGSRRFTRTELLAMGAAAGLRCQQATYWSFVLSPLILAVRTWQRFQLRRGWLKPEAVVSDVDLPPALFNRLFYWINRREAEWLTAAPFGSSVFLIFTPDSPAFNERTNA